ncbi:MAG TPA: MlaD family protein [Myxococcaceae bacterium]|nr:MlaD family protein [Myxococcaceae bacterium]
MKLVTPFRVGLLVLTSAVFLFVFFTFAKKGGLSQREALTVHAFFRDASGLSKKSRVQIAGISVGEISDIALQGNLAKVTLKVRRDVNLREDAAITKRSESLLGDYVLDLFPGTEAAPPMPDGGEIKRVIDTQGVEAIFSSLGQITSDIQAVTGAMREVFGGEKGEGSMGRIVDNLVRLSENFDTSFRESSQKLNSILENFQGVSADVREMTAGEGTSVREIVANINVITRDMREVVGTLRRSLAEPDAGVEGGMAGVRQMVDRLDHTLANFEQVSQRINEGKGTVGTLLADERLGQKLSETVEDVSDFASRLTRLQLEVGVRSEYLFSQGAAKNSFGIRLIPKPDRYYLIELVDDPRGYVDTQIVQRNPPDLDQPATQVQKITRDQLKITAEFAKRYYFATLRFGVIESSGGLGADFHFFRDAVSIKLDAFNISATELRYPRLRASIRVQAFQHLFANFGMDDILNRQVRDASTNKLIAGRDLFLGAGVFFTDDDLKAVFTAVPVRP